MQHCFHSLAHTPLLNDITLITGQRYNIAKLGYSLAIPGLYPALVLLLDQLHYHISCLVAVELRHLDVHNNEFISTIWAIAGVV